MKTSLRRALRAWKQPHLKVEGNIIDGVAFDLEGTLVNLEPLHWNAHIEAAKQILGLSDLSLNLQNLNDEGNVGVFEAMPHFIGGPTDAVMEDMVNYAVQKGVVIEDKEAKIAELKEFDTEIYQKELAALTPETIQVREGAIDFIKTLQKKGIPVAIGTVTNQDEATKILELSGLLRDDDHPDGLFLRDQIVLREDVGNPKPAPDVYEKTAERMLINPRFQLVFEDSPNGILAARDAGSIPMGVPLAYQPEIQQRMIENGARHIFTDWNQARTAFMLEGNRQHPEGRNNRSKER